MSEQNNQNTNPQQITQPADNGNSGGEKMFTQEDVNKIVSERLARDRESRAAQQQNDERETALKAREETLDCREFVKEQGYPEDLLDLLDTSNSESFKKTVEKLADVFGYKLPRFVYPPKFAATGGSRPQEVNDPIRDAFKA